MGNTPPREGSESKLEFRKKSMYRIDMSAVQEAQKDLWVLGEKREEKKAPNNKVLMFYGDFCFIDNG